VCTLTISQEQKNIEEALKMKQDKLALLKEWEGKDRPKAVNDQLVQLKKLKINTGTIYQRSNQNKTSFGNFFKLLALVEGMHTNYKTCVYVCVCVI
jgi:hypothetical protein